MIRSLNTKAAIVIAVTILLAGTSLLFTSLGFSDGGMHDAEYFMPAAINYATGHGLINQVTKTVSSIGDTSGESKFLSYPPLFPVVVSWFLRPLNQISYVQQTFVIAGLMNAINLILCAWILWKVASLHGRKIDWAVVAFICIVLLASLRPSLKFAGRPETLVRLFLSLGFLSVFYLRHLKINILIFAATLALALATYPIGLFFALVVGLFFSFRESRALLKILPTYILSVLLFLLIMQVSPFSIHDTLSGISRHSQETFSLFGSFERAFSLLGSPLWGLYAILIALLIFIWVKFYKKYQKNIQSPYLFVIFSLLSIWSLVYFLFLESRTYYLNVFFIFIFSAFTYYLFHIPSKNFIRKGIFVVTAMISIFSIQAILLFPFYLKNGISLAEARERFQEMTPSRPSSKLLVTIYSWVVSDDYQRMVRLDDVPPESLNLSLVILDQTYLNRLSPEPTFKNCPLEKNYFINQKPKIFNIPIADITPGYGFAVYNCP